MFSNDHPRVFVGRLSCQERQRQSSMWPMGVSRVIGILEAATSSGRASNAYRQRLAQSSFDSGPRSAQLPSLLQGRWQKNLLPQN